MNHENTSTGWAEANDERQTMKNVHYSSFDLDASDETRILSSKLAKMIKN
jgi:hypothetical protein